MADVFSKIRGIIGNLFRLGLGGPQLKNNSGVIEARNNDDSDFAVLRADAPAGNDDVVTKNYFDTNAPPGGDLLVRYAIAFDGGAQQDSASTIPANSRVVETRVEITTVFDDPAVTIDVGNTGTADAYADQTDIDVEVLGIYVIPQDEDSGVASVVRTALGAAASTQGEATITVRYAPAPLA